MNNTAPEASIASTVTIGQYEVRKFMLGDMPKLAKLIAALPKSLVKHFDGTSESNDEVIDKITNVAPEFLEDLLPVVALAIDEDTDVLKSDMSISEFIQALIAIVEVNDLPLILQLVKKNLPQGATQYLKSLAQEGQTTGIKS